MLALPPHSPRGRRIFLILQALTVLLLAVGLGVRGISADRPLPVEERSEVPPTEALQAPAIY